MVMLARQGRLRLSTNFDRSRLHRLPGGAPARTVRGVALGVLVSFCLSGLALGQGKGDESDDAATAKPALPNLYLDMRTIYSSVPAGSIPIGFGTPPLLSRLPNLSSLRTPISPSSQSLSVDLPFTV